jgi:hypothetical protein
MTLFSLTAVRLGYSCSFLLTTILVLLIFLGLFNTGVLGMMASAITKARTLLIVDFHIFSWLLGGAEKD